MPACYPRDKVLLQVRASFLIRGVGVLGKRRSGVSHTTFVLHDGHSFDLNSQGVCHHGMSCFVVGSELFVSLPHNASP